MVLEEKDEQDDKCSEDFDGDIFKDIQISPIRTLNFADKDNRDLESPKKEGLDMQESEDEINNIDNLGMQEEVGFMEKISLNQTSSKICEPKIGEKHSRGAKSTRERLEMARTTKGHTKLRSGRAYDSSQRQ